MKKLAIKELTLDGFHVYGTFANLINPNTPRLGAEPVEFFRDMAVLTLAQNCAPSFSVCRVLKRPLVIGTVEYHTHTGEGILPLDGDVLIHVGVATPNGEVPLDKLEVFRVPRGTVVMLRPGVWHEAPFAHGCGSVNILIVLPERIYANDCTALYIPDDQKIQIGR